MSRGRRPSKHSKHYVPAEIWDNAVTFCRCYPLWVAELSVCDSSRAIRYDNVRVQTTNDYDPTEELALRRAKLREKIAIVENAAKEAADSEAMQKFLIMGVAHHLSYETLRTQNIPCGRRMYHELRREMIYLVSREIG